MDRHSTEEHHRRNFERLRISLRSDERHEARELLKKLTRCGDPNLWSGSYFCRSPSCPSCRDRYIGKQRRELQKTYATTPREDLGSLSVVLGITKPDDIENVGTIWSSSVRSLRNRIAYLRCRDPAWNNVAVHLWLEVDAVHVDDISSLGTDKRRQLDELGYEPYGASGTVFIVTAHGVIHTGPDLSVDSIQITLSSKWKAHKQVLVVPFSDEKSVKTNIGGITNYALKSRFKTTLSEKRKIDWYGGQILAFALWTEGYSSSYKSLRMVINPKRVALSCTSVEGDSFSVNHTSISTGTYEDQTPSQQPSVRKHASVPLINTTESPQGSEGMLSFMNWMHKPEVEEAEQVPVNTPEEPLDLFEEAPPADTPSPPRKPFKAARTMGDVFAAELLPTRPRSSPPRTPRPTFRDVFAGQAHGSVSSGS